MKNLAAMTILSFVTLAPPALAGECDQWSAAMQEDEGGPVMTAAICAPKSASQPLLVTCGDDALAFRWLPDMPDTFPPGGNMEYKARLTLNIDGKAVSLEAGYEAMDGAMAFYPRRNDPLIALLKHGNSLEISDPKKVLPTVTFTLKKARQALEKVEKSCGG